MTEASILKAIPTEYKGVVFRSKCEALFARNLDLSGGWLWEYEPFEFRSKDGWQPDFRLAALVPTRVMGGWSIPQGIADALLEYKPSDVTDTYLDHAATRAFDIASKNQIPFSFFIVCGSPFNRIRKSYWLLEGRFQLQEGHCQWLEWIDEAREYRFDLKDAPF